MVSSAPASTWCVYGYVYAYALLLLCHQTTTRQLLHTSLLTFGRLRRFSGDESFATLDRGVLTGSNAGLGVVVERQKTGGGVGRTGTPSSDKSKL